MWRGRAWVLVLFGALFLSACTENAELFSSLDEPEDPVLVTVASGTAVRNDEFLELRIDYPDEESSRATWLVAELRDPSGTVHGRVEFGRDDLAEPALPPVQLPDPPDGVYRLFVEAWINDQLLFAEERQIFVLSDLPRIESITIHPTSIHTDMEALAIAEISYPDGTKPYLRWLFDGREVRQGYLSGGSGQAILHGGSRTVGAYSVSLEVYPWGPDEGAVIDGATAVVGESDVYVHEALPLAPPTLDSELEIPEASLFRYFSFEGTRRGWTFDDSDTVEATLDGSVFLGLTAGSLGLRIEPGATVTTPVAPFPEEGEAYLLVVEWASLLDDDSDEGPGPVMRVGETRLDLADPYVVPADAEETDAETVEADTSDSPFFETTTFLLEGGREGVVISKYPSSNETERFVPTGAEGEDLAVAFSPAGNTGEFFLNEVIVLALYPLETGDAPESTDRDSLEGTLSGDVDEMSENGSLDVPASLEGDEELDDDVLLEAEPLNVSEDATRTTDRDPSLQAPPDGSPNQQDDFSDEGDGPTDVRGDDDAVAHRPDRFSIEVDRRDSFADPAPDAPSAIRWTVLEKWWPPYATNWEESGFSTSDRPDQDLPTQDRLADEQGLEEAVSESVEVVPPAVIPDRTSVEGDVPSRETGTPVVDRSRNKSAEQETNGPPGNAVGSGSDATREEQSETVETVTEEGSPGDENDSVSRDLREDPSNELPAGAADQEEAQEPDEATSAPAGVEGEAPADSRMPSDQIESSPVPDAMDEPSLRPESNSPAGIPGRRSGL